MGDRRDAAEAEEKSALRGATIVSVAAMLIALLTLAACGGPIDKDRPPLPKDYQPPPIDGFPDTGPPKRI